MKRFSIGRYLSYANMRAVAAAGRGGSHTVRLGVAVLLALPLISRWSTR
jgi:hypothetical protein